MANVCSDTVVLFPKEDTPGNAVSRLKEDLLGCYPSMGIHADTRLVLLLERTVFAFGEMLSAWTLRTLIFA